MKATKNADGSMTIVLPDDYTYYRVGNKLVIHKAGIPYRLYKGAYPIEESYNYDYLVKRAKEVAESGCNASIYNDANQLVLRCMGARYVIKWSGTSDRLMWCGDGWSTTRKPMLYTSQDAAHSALDYLKKETGYDFHRVERHSS